MLERLYQIDDSRTFCAGFVTVHGRCTESAPYLFKLCVGKHISEIVLMCKENRWTLHRGRMLKRKGRK
jgi:hypothetical protein